MPLADDDSGTLLAQDAPLLGLGAVTAPLLPAEEAEDTARAFLSFSDGVGVGGKSGILPSEV